MLFPLDRALVRCDALRCDAPSLVGHEADMGAFQPNSSFLRQRRGLQVRRDDEGRVSPSPFSWSSSLEAERLNPLVLVGLVGDRANGC
jgi:hypothetical protein